MSKQKNGLKTIWFFLRPHKFYFAFLLIVCLLNGILETLQIAVLYPILSGALNIQAGQNSSFFLILIGKLAKVIPIGDVVIANCIMFIILTVLAFLFRMLYLLHSARLNSKISMENMQKVFRKYTDSDYQFFVDNKQGELLYKATTAPMYVTDILGSLSQFLVDAILTVSILVLVFSLSWQGAILVAAIGAGYLYFARYLGTRVSYVAGEGTRVAGETQIVIVSEYIAGAKPIKVFGSSPHWQTEYARAVKKYWGFWRKSVFWLQTPINMINLLLYSMITIVVIIIKIQNPAGFVSIIPIFGTFAFAMFRLLPKLQNFGAYQMQIMSSLPNVQVVQGLLQDTTYNKIKNGNKNFSKLESCIEFRSVNFTHKNREATLTDVSFKIGKDKKTAIVGASGTGKSTIVDLLLRLHDVDKGGIYIDNIDLKEYNISSVWKKIGFVGQETFIHNESVKDNISFGNTYTMPEIIEAAILANAHDFIQELPQRYDTVVGDRGVRLSGGEKQRLAIARAMIRKPEILVLDEATSSLDNISQQVVQEAIDKVAEKCTTLIIAHRLSTIRSADMIYVLDKGKVIESGTHDQLISQKGKYWDSYSGQGE